MFGVRLDTVKSWSAGRNQPPAGVVADLRDLYVKIERSAAEMLATIDGATADAGHPPEAIELGLAGDDHEARDIGWPCVGAQRAALGIVAARSPILVVVVPRGSTPATAAAADRHERG